MAEFSCNDWGIWEVARRAIWVKGLQDPKPHIPLLADPRRSREHSGVGVSEANGEVSNSPEPPGLGVVFNNRFRIVMENIFY
jgi:hypothetical protein